METAPRNCKISVPCRGRTCPELLNQFLVTVIRWGFWGFCGAKTVTKKEALNDCQLSSRKHGKWGHTSLGDRLPQALDLGMNPWTMSTMPDRMTRYPSLTL